MPVGLVSWGGTDMTGLPSIWIGEKQKGYGRRAIELLAEETLKAGVKELATAPPIRHGGDYYIAASKLVRHLREYWAKIRKR